MDNTKNQNKITLILLIIFIITTLTLGGYIIYDKLMSKKEQNNEIINNNININNDTTINQDTLKELLKILGISEENDEFLSCINCLNYYISNNNYSENAENIISYYEDTYGNILESPPTEVYNSAECGIGAADCYSISKKNAEYLFKVYNFKGNIEDYFRPSSKMEEAYLFTYNHSLGLCEYDITHQITSKYVNGNDIRINDIQNVYKLDEKTNVAEKTETKNVTYDFKQDEEGFYYLYKVDVK